MIKLLERLFARPIIAIELLAVSFFINLLALASTLYVIQVLNRYVSFGVHGTLVTLTAGLLIAAILEFSFRQIRHRLAHGLNVKSDWLLNTSAYNALIRIKSELVLHLNPATRAEIMRGLDSVQQAYNPSNISTILDIPFALLYLVVLFLLSPSLAFTALLGVLLATSIVLLRSKPIQRSSNDFMDATANGRSLTAAAIQSVDTLRAFNGADRMMQLWQSNRLKQHHAWQKLGYNQGMTQSLNQFFQVLMTCSMIAGGAILVVAGELSIGALIGANILASRALTPTLQFARLIEPLIAAKRAQKLLTEFTKVPVESEDGKALRHYEGRLEFKDVSFSFPRDVKPLFESLSFSLNAGHIMVVTGFNGAGKTSFTRLIPGLLEPKRGQIFADGVDIRHLSPSWWRQQIIYMPQEPDFLNLTIAENIELNMPPSLKDKDRQELLNRVIEQANLKNYLNTTAKGLGTLITEGGTTLPLGIRRRLALARALASSGKLCVLDEPTEGLDGDGTKAVYAILNELVHQKRTLIISSHDKNILKNADFLLDLSIKPIPRLLKNDRQKHA